MSWHRFKEAVRDGVNPQVAAQESVVWKKNSSAPDYTPMAQASKEAAEIMAGLGEKQLAFAQSQYAENAPLMRQIANQQMAAQQQQMQQAQDYYNYQQRTFRPLEKSIVADAQNFNTDAYRQSQAQKAAAEAGRAQAATQQANLRAAASMGLNPNSGRFAGMNASSNLGLAAQRAAAMTGARQSAEQMGYARKLDAAGLGRNLAGASTAAYGGATAAGNAAGVNYQSAGQNYLGSMGQAANTIGSGYNMQLQGLGNVLNNQTKMALEGGTDWGGIGMLMGGAAKFGTAAGMFS